MKEQSCFGILIHRTDLANDDAILEVFTDEFGLVTIFVKKFNRSKRRKAEIDFFRLLDLELVKKNNGFALRKAKTRTVFHEFQKNYQASKIGFEWLGLLKGMLAAEKHSSAFFSQVLAIWTHFHVSHLDYWDLFFRTKCLVEKGECPLLDKVRDDIYFDVAQKKSFVNEAPNRIYLSNNDRQVFEFLRRTELGKFEQKIAKLPSDSVPKLRLLICELEKYIH